MKIALMHIICKCILVFLRIFLSVICCLMCNVRNANQPRNQRVLNWFYDAKNRAEECFNNINPKWEHESIWMRSSYLYLRCVNHNVRGSSCIYIIIFFGAKYLRFFFGAIRQGMVMMLKTTSFSFLGYLRCLTLFSEFLGNCFYLISEGFWNYLI